MADTYKTTPTTKSKRSWTVILDAPLTSFYLVGAATIVLLLLGLVMVLSSSSITALANGDSPYAEFLKQSRYALIGIPIFYLCSRVPLAWWKKLSWPVLVGALFLQALAVFTPLGRGSGGNEGWLSIGGQAFQPAEFLKFGLCLWLGCVLSRKRELLNEWRHAAVIVLPVVVISLGLVLKGRDLGTALVLMVLIVGGLWVAGLPLRMFMASAAGLGAVAVYLAVNSTNRMNRLGAWMGDNCDATSECYQTLHGEYGLASGGFFGVGLGASSQKWSYLPESSNDFIFAIIGEELGLLGTLLILFLFFALAVGLARVVRRHQDMFVKIATGAVLSWIIGQAFINIGVVIGFLPVIGVPLPLVSSGGSALISSLAALGMVMSFARTEPGATKALTARPGVVRRSLAVLGRSKGAKK